MRISGTIRSMTRSSVAVLALVALTLALVPGLSRAAVFSPQTATLDNGMQVVLVENHRAPVVTHMVWYKVGSADEPQGVSGIAHFLEHLMFKGTDKMVPGDFSKIVARNGGNDNAFTSWDYTGYFQNIARDRLDLVMEMEADRMTNLKLSDDVVLPERDVIIEERRSRIDTSPGALLGEQMRASLYMAHPYGRSIIGWRHEMEKLSTEDALEFYRDWYAPNNAILVVAGDITMDELLPMAEKYYGVIPRGKDMTRNRVQEPVQHAPRKVTMRDPQVGQASWSRYYLAPSYNTDAADAVPLDVLSEIIGSGTTSRFFKALVVDQEIASSVGTFYDPVTVDLASFGVYAVPRGDVDLADLEKAVEAEIAKVVADGVTQDELDRAKQKLLDSAVFARDSLSAGARVLGQSLAVGLTVDQVESWPDRISGVTVEQVNDAAKRVFDAKKSVTGWLMPPEGGPVTGAGAALPITSGEGVH
ncbi:MAG: insulinase family protein [Thalassospira sp.]|uniref:Zinc protease n=2 Tax=Thalassospira tepidiphila TaxID=393657 RepID=A0A853L3Q5_9PROT|nr:insulinase family protein [Thalassospira sp.]MBO6802081.1 insulinase family protein [Thalassospira sp.]MBO6817284.1 insulinase family protein [Thalassospira sp.]MBO6889417.1 insulinase family protein [Thalassospira sp.]OAZ11960.1 zinc protease [Thalassospira tepidiphila MCCC 1A03514]